MPALSRARGHGRAAGPVRIVHLGLGNFFRAHQAWYTEQAPDRTEWGISAFTGRSPSLADLLHRQGGLYTLLTRGEAGDSFEIVSSLSEVHAAAEHDAWLAAWRSPEVAITTLTVTEAGYLVGQDGELELGNDQLQADLIALRHDACAPMQTVVGKVAAGALARHTAGRGRLTVLPCDNLPGNGTILAKAVEQFLAEVDPQLAGWLDDTVAFGTTVVDRITPSTTEELRTAVFAATGVWDAAPVSTERFSEWIIEADFPAGRPAWDEAGARIVSDVIPFEQRKLAMLNGSHSLLAYIGLVAGYETVSEAIRDPQCRAWVERWWDEAAAHIQLPAGELAAYRAALVERYRNPNIRHTLAQIATDGSLKLPIRILPTLRAEREAGRVPHSACLTLAAWILLLRTPGFEVGDARGADLGRLAAGDLSDSVRRTLAFLDDRLAVDQTVVEAVLAAVVQLEPLKRLRKDS